MRRTREAAGPRVLGVVVYGSVARGEAGPESDVDLLVRWDGDEREGRETIDPIAGDIFVRTGVLLSPYVVGTPHWDRLQAIGSLFLASVQREGTLVPG